MRLDNPAVRTVGLFSAYVPRELLYALGCTPLWVFPSAAKPTAAEAFLPRNFCALNRLILASFVEDGDAGLDAVVFADEDDAARRVSDGRKHDFTGMHEGAVEHAECDQVPVDDVVPGVEGDGPEGFLRQVGHVAEVVPDGLGAVAPDAGMFPDAVQRDGEDAVFDFRRDGLVRHWSSPWWMDAG